MNQFITLSSQTGLIYQTKKDYQLRILILQNHKPNIMPLFIQFKIQFFMKKINAFLSIFIVGLLFISHTYSLTTVAPTTQLRPVSNPPTDSNKQGLGLRQHVNPEDSQQSLINLLFDQVLVNQLQGVIAQNKDGNNIKTGQSVPISASPSIPTPVSSPSTPEASTAKIQDNQTISIPILGDITKETKKNWGWVYFIIGLVLFALGLLIICANEKKCAIDSRRITKIKKKVQIVNPDSWQKVMDSQDKLVYVNGLLKNVDQQYITDSLTGVRVKDCLLLTRKVFRREKKKNLLGREMSQDWVEHESNMLSSIVGNITKYVNLARNQIGFNAGQPNQPTVDHEHMILASQKIIAKNIKIGYFIVGDSLKDDIQSEDHVTLCADNLNQLLKYTNHGSSSDSHAQNLIPQQTKLQGKGLDQPQSRDFNGAQNKIVEESHGEWDGSFQQNQLYIYKHGQSKTSIGSYKIQYTSTKLCRVSILSMSKKGKKLNNQGKEVFTLLPYHIEDEKDSQTPQFLTSYRLIQNKLKPIENIDHMMKEQQGQNQMISHIINNNNFNQFKIRMIAGVLLWAGLLIAAIIPFVPISFIKSHPLHLIIGTGIIALILFFIILSIVWLRYVKNKWSVMIVGLAISAIIILIVVGILWKMKPPTKKN